MKNTIKMTLATVLLAVSLVTVFALSTPLASVGVGDKLGFKGLICACKNTNGVCYESMKEANCNHNVLTNVGKEAIQSYLSTTYSRQIFSYLAVGNGTAPLATDTTLNLELTGSMARANATIYDNAASNGNWSLVYTWTAGATFVSVNSTAIFNQSATGGMFAGGTFSNTNLNSGDTLTVNYTLALAT